MGGRSLVAASLVVVAALVGWIWHDRCGAAPHGQSAGETVETTADGGSGAQRSGNAEHSRGRTATPRPSLGSSGASAGPASPAAFADEDLDGAWAEPKARELSELLRGILAGERLAGLVKAGPVSCRSTHCRFLLSARESRLLHDAIAVLGDERGLSGEAEQMKLSDLTSTTVNVTLRFRRLPQPGDPVPDQ